MRFTKMQGVGNDFIVFSQAEVVDLDLPELARRACDRHFGVGADGILVPGTSEVADLEMVYYNADGSPSEMCGNGLRCLARFAKDHGLVEGEALTVDTGAGVKKVVMLGGGFSRVDMGVPAFDSEVELHGFRFLRVSMGNPHAVALCGSEEEVVALDLNVVGPKVERDPLFPEKTNVEFVYVRAEHEVRMRVWERGAGETLASGSGSCAAAVAAVRGGRARGPVRGGRARGPVRVVLDGGVVEVEWEGGSVYMTGPAE